MKRIFLVAISNAMDTSKASYQLDKLNSKLKKMSLETKTSIFSSHNQISEAQISDTQFQIIEAFQYSLQADWPSDYYAVINFDLNPKAVELTRLLEMVRSKFADCAFASGVIGKNTKHKPNLLNKLSSWAFSHIYSDITYFDFKSSMLVMNQTSALSLRNHLARVENKLSFIEIITKLHHFGAITHAVPVTDSSNNRKLKTLYQNLTLARQNFIWKPKTKRSSSSIVPSFAK